MSQKLTSQDLARMFCNDKTNYRGVVYVKNIDTFGVYQEDRHFFKLMEDKDFEPFLFKWLLTTDISWQKNMSPGMVKDIAKFIKWLMVKQCEDINTNYIAMQDKVLNLNTFEYEDPDPDKMVFYYVDCMSTDVQAGYGTPEDSLWMKFITEVLVDKDNKPHSDTIKVVQEMMGYYLLNTIEGQASFFLNGKGQNGKSVFLSVLRYMVGQEFSAAITVEELTTKEFAAASLIGKKVNICSEDESKFTRADKFKTLISGDDISVRRIYGSHFNWRPNVKHIFSTNDMPTFSGLSFALVRRIKIIPFNYKIPENIKDSKLTLKLYRELPKIVAWALEGAKRLVANEFKWSQSELVDQKIEEFKDNLSAALMFFKENYEPDSSCFIADDDMYINYKLWCENRGKKVQNFYNFIKDIEDNLELEKDTRWQEEKNKIGRKIRVKKDELQISF